MLMGTITGTGTRTLTMDYELCTMNYIKHPYSFIHNP